MSDQDLSGLIEQASLLAKLNSLISPQHATIEMKRQIAKAAILSEPTRPNAINLRSSVHRILENRASVSERFKVFYFPLDLKNEGLTEEKLKKMKPVKIGKIIAPLFEERTGMTLDMFEDVVRQVDPKFHIRFDYKKLERANKESKQITFVWRLVYPATGYKEFLAMTNIFQAPRTDARKYGSSKHGPAEPVTPRPGIRTASGGSYVVSRTPEAHTPQV